MKKCDYFKDLILTSFIDGESDRNSTREVESHLLECTDCRVFLNEVRGSTVGVFQKVLPQPVPVQLWQGIRQRIEDENQAAGLRWGFWPKLKGLFVFPRMVPVFASFVVMILAGSVTLNTIQIRQAQAKDQGEYLVSLLSSTDATDTSDSEMPIEHYFL